MTIYHENATEKVTEVGRLIQAAIDKNSEISHALDELSECLKQICRLYPGTQMSLVSGGIAAEISGTSEYSGLLGESLYEMEALYRSLRWLAVDHDKHDSI